jgi:hypothetical protein
MFPVVLHVNLRQSVALIVWPRKHWSWNVYLQFSIYAFIRPVGPTCVVRLCTVG